MTNTQIQKNDLYSPKGGVLIQLHDAKTGKLKYEEFNQNMIVDTGKTSLASALTGVTANNQGIITYCAVGTGTTAPTESDTDLETELFRKLVSVRSSSGNVATFQTFYTTSEANGTLGEAGLFGDDASGTADSGTMFARVLISRTKTSNDTLTLTWTITIG